MAGQAARDRPGPSGAVLETPRLRLRPGGEGDVDGLCAGLNDWAVAQWVVRPPYPYEPRDALAYIALTATVCGAGFHPFRVIAARDTDALLGGISLEPDGAGAVLGYWLRPSAWGCGYMPEAAGALLADARRRLAGLAEIHATTDPENAASQSVLRRLGFACVGDRPATGCRRGASRSLVFARRL
ncbi:GNAT family N-acetyltransferase [Rhodovastum atsumiense]|nr:GNAT family N-acetyltransferase [Rhodovastum atsumiense]